MSSDIRVGDRVKLLGMADSLIHDLPLIEQEEMRSFIWNRIPFVKALFLKDCHDKKNPYCEAGEADQAGRAGALVCLVGSAFSQ